MARPRGRRRRVDDAAVRLPARALAVVIPLGLAATASWLGAYSAFTDTVSATSSFSTGTIDVTANGSQGPTYSFSTLDVAGLVPGASATYAQLAVANIGTASLTWSMPAPTISNATLGNAMAIGIVRTATSGCTSTTYGTGTTVYAEATGLSAATVPSRALAAGATDYLCFKVSLPAAATNTVMGLTTTATFVVNATT